MKRYIYLLSTVFVLILLVNIVNLQAQLYKWKDKNGVTRYSNVPPTNNEVVPEVIDKEIKYSDEYYKEIEQKQKQAMEQQQKEQENRDVPGKEYKHQKDEQKRINDEIEKKKQYLIKFKNDKAKRSLIISTFGNPDNFGITNVKVNTWGGTHISEELWYKNFLGDGKLLIIKLWDKRFDNYEFK